MEILVLSRGQRSDELCCVPGCSYHASIFVGAEGKLFSLCDWHGRQEGEKDLSDETVQVIEAMAEAADLPAADEVGEHATAEAEQNLVAATVMPEL